MITRPVGYIQAHTTSYTYNLFLTNNIRDLTHTQLDIHINDIDIRLDNTVDSDPDEFFLFIQRLTLT